MAELAGSDGKAFVPKGWLPSLLHMATIVSGSWGLVELTAACALGTGREGDANQNHLGSATIASVLGGFSHI